MGKKSLKRAMQRTVAEAARQRRLSHVAEPVTRDQAAPSPSADLTDAQVSNWRRVLSGIIGPYAYLMPESGVKEVREAMQKRCDELAAGKEVAGS